MAVVLGDDDSSPIKQPFSLKSISHRKPFNTDLSQKWLHKKVNFLWKFSIIMVLALGVLYVGFSTMEMPSSVQIFKQGVKDFTGRCSISTQQDMHYPQPTTFDRRECSCIPVHYFVIVSMQRSGSGWFETLLNSHKNVRSHGEVFLITTRRKNMTMIKESLDTLYNLDWVSKYHKKDCTTAVGFKWMLNQGFMEYKPEVLAYLKEKSVSVIFLFRRNILERYISLIANKFDQHSKLLNGTHRAHVHSIQEANILASYKPLVNLTLVIPDLKSIEDIMIDAQQSFSRIRNIVVYYEDLLQNKEELIKVQQFLYVKPRKLKSKHVKIHTLPLADRVENWNDLSKLLNGTKYEPLVH